MDFIFEYINNISNGNQMIAGAITLTFSGLVMWGIKEFPKIILNLIKSQMITSMSLNNSGWDKERTFVTINEFLSKLTTEYGSRTLILDSIWVNGVDTMVLTLGYGKHFFFYKNRLMWIDRTKLESSGSERQKEEVRLYTFGRSHEIFYTLVEENRPKIDDSFINFSEYKEGWQVKAKISKQGLDTLAIDSEVSNIFTKEMDYFKNNKEDYRKFSLPYKMTWVLFGESGSGKSSIIRAIASTYSMNLCNLPLSGLSDMSFKDAILSSPENSIIVIEDFDSCGAVLKRKGVQGVPDTDSEGERDNFSFLTLSGILNTLDGVASLDNKIIIFTTNCLDKVDTALLRAGRVDKIIELPKITGKVVKKYFENMYNIMIDFELKPMSAKEINRVIFKNKCDVDSVIKDLKETYYDSIKK